MGFSTAGGGPFSTGPKMNVTPLIDVLLVLLIVFMLVVIEQRPAGLKTEIPQQPNPNDQTNSAAPSDDRDSRSIMRSRKIGILVQKIRRANSRKGSIRK